MPLEVEKVPIYWLTSQMSREPWLNSAKWFPTGCGRNPGTCIITCCLSRCVSTGRQIEAQPTSVKHPDNGMHECHLNHEANTATPFLFCSYCITLLHCTGEWRIFFLLFLFLLLFAFVCKGNLDNYSIYTIPVYYFVNLLCPQLSKTLEYKFSFLE